MAQNRDGFDCATLAISALKPIASKACAAVSFSSLNDASADRNRASL